MTTIRSAYPTPSLLDAKSGTFQLKNTSTSASTSDFLSGDPNDELSTVLSLSPGTYLFTVRTIEWTFEGYVFPALPVEIQGVTPSSDPSTTRGLPNFAFTSSNFEIGTGQTLRGDGTNSSRYRNFPVCAWKNPVVPYPADGKDPCSRAGFDYQDYVFSDAMDRQIWSLNQSYKSTIEAGSVFYWNWRLARPYSSTLFDYDPATLVQDDCYAWFAHQIPNNPQSGPFYPGWINSDFVVTIDYEKIL